MKTKEDILQRFLGLHAEDPITEMDEFQKSAAYDAMDQYAAQVLENQDPWISVKDRLPTPLQDVICFESKYQSILIAYMNTDNEWRSYGDLEPFVTHWKALPTTPIKPEE